MPSKSTMTVRTTIDVNTGGGRSGIFHFVRHGVTEHNLREIRCGGDLDVDMAELGREQARRAADQLRTMQLDIGLIVSSALVRTRETARIVSEALAGIPIMFEPLLNERCLGAWNEQPLAATEALLRSNVTPPGGEPEDAFMRRIAAALETLVPSLPARLLVVGSSGVGRAMHTLLGGEGRLRVSNGEIVQFNIDRNSFALTIPQGMPKETSRPTRRG